MSSITNLVADKIANSNQEVQNRLVEILAEKEISKRVDLLVQGLDKLDALEKEIKKIASPDVVTYKAENGVPVKVEMFSEERVKQQTAASKNLQNLNEAIEQALVHNDFKKLSELSRSK